MSFSATQEQGAIIDSLDRFMSRAFPPEEVRRHDREHRTPTHLLPGFAELGILGIAFPETYGGLDGDWQTVVRVQERLGWHASIAASLYSITVDFGGMSLLTYGTEEQRRRLLPALIEGRAQLSLALTEPQAGTDAAAMITTARRDGTSWRISGRKTWISCADTSDWLVTSCRSTPGSTGRDGISILLIPRTAEGIHMTRLPKVGNNSLTSWAIAFDDVRVGATR
jgi:alkylation response protein AidB-like acyl-CoA dehydrogenase